MSFFSFLVAWRYVRTKQRTRFISFITGASVLGIALGVAILITVLSVMNGFNQVIRHRILNMAHHISMQPIRTTVSDSWEVLIEKVQRHPEIVGAAPILAKQALMLQTHEIRPIYLHGILPALEKTVSSLPEWLSSNEYSLKKGEYSIVLGTQLAIELGIRVGDRVSVLIPPNPINLAKFKPQIQIFTVRGFFKVGQGFGFEHAVAYTHLEDIQTLYQLEASTIGFRLKAKDLYHASRIAHELKQRFPAYQIHNWTEDYRDLLYALQLEKNMMFLTLLLLIAMAVFNLISSLMMVVNDKQADIAILRTLGATPRTILWIFIGQGSLIGFTGTLLGVLAGLFVSSQVSTLVSLIEQCFHMELFAHNAYLLVDQLPAKIECLDVIKVSITSLLMSVVATLYPARRASKLPPTHALRYE